jgi:hypothetical protein
MAVYSLGITGQPKAHDLLLSTHLFQHPGSFVRQGATGAIVVIEANVDEHHFRVKRIADTDDSQVFEVHLT